MPRFFFHVHDGQERRDQHGSDLIDIDDAKHYATQYAGELLQNETASFWNGEEWKMDVTDGSGLILFSLIFAAIDAPAIRKQ